MKTRKRKNRIGKRKNRRPRTERRLGTENLEGRILMAADMGGWPDASQASDEAEVKTDPGTTQKKTAVQSKKEEISFYAKKQPTLSVRHAERPVAELPNKMKPEIAEHMEVHGEELADAQEIERLEGGLEEISKLKGTSETSRILDDHGMFSNDIFGSMEDTMAERNGSLDSRLDSFTPSTGRSDASSAIEQGRGRASQPTTDSNGNVWFETKSPDGKKSVLFSPDRKLPGETSNGGTIIVVQHTDQGTTITYMSNTKGALRVQVLKCDNDGCDAFTPETKDNTKGEGKNPDTIEVTTEPSRPAPGDAGSGTPVTAAMAREALAKFSAEHGGRSWDTRAGKPVPGTDGDHAIDPVASRQLFDQLGRHKWNPRIVQPGPDGDNENNYLAMKESPSNLAFIKMEMIGKPTPDDPDWGSFGGTQGGGSSGGSVNPQPVTTQKPAAADDASGEEEVPQQED